MFSLISANGFNERRLLEWPGISARRGGLHQLLHSATIWRQRLTVTWWNRQLQSLASCVSICDLLIFLSRLHLRQEARQRRGCLRRMHWLAQKPRQLRQARVGWSSSEGWCKNTATSLASSSWWWETPLAGQQCECEKSVLMKVKIML